MLCTYSAKQGRMLTQVVYCVAFVAFCNAAASTWNYQESIPKVEGNFTVSNETSRGNASFEINSNEDCHSQMGMVVNDVVNNTMRDYQMKEILLALGGAPGEVNLTWNSPGNDRNISEVYGQWAYPPEKLEEQSRWLYDYRASDYATFLRMEHAVKQRSGTPDEYLDIRGEVYWTPHDFCGNARHATYRQDNKGFQANVSLDYCQFGEKYLWCATVPYCHKNATHSVCVG